MNSWMRECGARRVRASPPRRRTSAWQLPPDGLEQRKNLGFRLLQLGVIEGKEVVHPKVRLSHFREELLLIGQCIMAGAVPGDVQDFLAVAAHLKLLPGRGDLRFVE